MLVHLHCQAEKSLAEWASFLLLPPPSVHTFWVEIQSRNIVGVRRRRQSRQFKADELKIEGGVRKEVGIRKRGAATLVLINGPLSACE